MISPYSFTSDKEFFGEEIFSSNQTMTKKFQVTWRPIPVPKGILSLFLVGNVLQRLMHAAAIILRANAICMHGAGQASTPSKHRAMIAFIEKGKAMRRCFRLHSRFFMLAKETNYMCRKQIQMKD